jgi:hypothetical protein
MGGSSVRPISMASRPPASQSSAANNKAPDITEETGVEWGFLPQSSR